MRRVVGHLERWLHEAWQFELTPAGKVMLVAILFCAAGSSLTLLSIPVYHLVTALVAIYVVSYVVSFALRPRLQIDPRIPSKATAGQPVPGHFRITNCARISAYDLGVGFFRLPPAVAETGPGHIVRELGPGQSERVDFELYPRRRGLHNLGGYRGYSSFPLGFHRRGTPRQETRPLLVLPAFHPLASLNVPLGRRHQPGGITLTSNVGESPEYVGNRDYRPGDPMRRICFKSWARLNKPVVREYQEEYYCRIGLILDTYVPRRRRRPAGGFPELEAGVSLSAAVADALTGGEHIIDVFAAGPELYVFRAGRHLAHIENVLETLACVDACRQSPFDKITPALNEELRNITAVICVLLDWDRPRRELVRTAVEAGCQTRVAVIRDGAPTEPIEPAEEWAGPIARFTPQHVLDGGVDRL
ncbi:MAG: DUF58 domain-containing protein [Planctomycetota bacterium]